MAYEQRDMSGSLFKNEDKRSETSSNARGSALIDGVAYFVDAWTKTDKNGNKWQSLSFKKKEKQASKPQVKTGTGFDDMEDDGPPF